MSLLESVSANGVEPQTQIFPASLKLSKEEADKLLANTKLPARRLEEFKAILSFLYDASADERINTDALVALTNLTSEEVTATLWQMEDLGLLVNDSKLTLYVRHGVVGPSTQRLQANLDLESALFDLLQEQAPEAQFASSAGNFWEGGYADRKERPRPLRMGHFLSKN